VTCESRQCNSILAFQQNNHMQSVGQSKRVFCWCQTWESSVSVCLLRHAVRHNDSNWFLHCTGSYIVLVPTLYLLDANTAAAKSKGASTFIPSTQYSHGLKLKILLRDQIFLATYILFFKICLSICGFPVLTPTTASA
jgi:hypothetical protein